MEIMNASEMNMARMQHKRFFWIMWLLLVILAFNPLVRRLMGHDLWWHTLGAGASVSAFLPLPDDRLFTKPAPVSLELVLSWIRQGRRFVSMVPSTFSGSFISLRTDWLRCAPFLALLAICFFFPRRFSLTCVDDDPFLS
jgi:hypothetical protein